MTATRALLAKRPVRLLFAARTVSVFGDMLIPVALSFAVLEAFGSASALGVVLGARFAPMVLFFLAGGVAADRMPRRMVMVASNAANFLIQSTTGLILLLGVADVWHLVVLSALKGTATAFFVPASNGVVAEIVDDDDLQPAYGLFAVAGSVAEVAGPAIAGVVVALVGPATALLLDAVTFVVAGGLISRMGSLGRSAAKTGDSMWSDLREGWHHVRARTWLWVMISSAGMFQAVVIATVHVLGPVVAERSLGGAAAWAVVVTGFGVGSVLGSVVSMRMRFTRPLATTYALLLFAGAPTLFLLAVPAPTIVIAATEVVSGFAIGVFGTVEATLIAEKVPLAALSRVSAYDYVGSMALRPLGLVLVGPVAAAVGTRATLVGAAVVTLAVVAWPLSYREVRGLRSGAVDAAAAGQEAGKDHAGDAIDAHVAGGRPV